MKEVPRVTTEPQTSELEGVTEETVTFPQNGPFDIHGSGDQLNAAYGINNQTKGTGPQLPGAVIGNAYFNSKGVSNPLQECLTSLAFPDMNSRSYDIGDAVQGTCEWLFRHKAYEEWTSCGQGLLWIRGKPGSGKSTLMGHILRNIKQEETIRDGALILSFFFHGRGSELQRTPFGLFRSLLHQLLQQIPEALSDLVDTFQKRCEENGKYGESWQWHQGELLRILKSSFSKLSELRSVWLYIDAVDECGQENAVQLVQDFKSLLQGLPPSRPQFHICFSCRHWPSLDLDSAYEVCLESVNGSDISTFVHQELLNQTSPNIACLIANRANGVFLWARLAVKRTLELEMAGSGMKTIEAEISSIPKELHDLYHDLIRNLDTESLKLFEWVCFATRPLSLEELRWALSVEPHCRHKSLRECEIAQDYPSDHDRMKRRIQTLSRGLIEVTLETKVQYIHQSVEDFFVKNGLSAPGMSTGAAQADHVVGIAHHRISMTCLRYLKMANIRQNAYCRRDILRLKFPLLHYSTTSWVMHAKQSDRRGIIQEDILKLFSVPSKTLIERWIEAYKILEPHHNARPPNGTSLVHVLSTHGVVTTLRALLDTANQRVVSIDAMDSGGRTPLLLAARNGHVVIVQLLLNYGAQADSMDFNGQTPLLIAAIMGHDAVLQLLLNYGARANHMDRMGWTPILFAAINGHETVAQLLLDHGAQADSLDYAGQTPLFIAAIRGYDAILQLLLKYGAQANHMDKMGWTPILCAAMSGHETVVQLLLDHGVQADSADNVGRTPLLMASGRGYKAIVQLLLSYRAQADSMDCNGQTSLFHAAMNGHEAVLQLLLDHGAQADSMDCYGQTPLFHAAENGHNAIVQLLLNHGAQTNSMNNMGLTPVLVAAQNGHKTILQLLLNHDAQANIVDKIG